MKTRFINFEIRDRALEWSVSGAFVICVVFLLSSFLLGTFKVKAATKTWDGGGADNNWSTCANWNLDTCPAAADTVTFDGTSTKDVTVDASFAGTIANVNINTGYTGTITLARSFTVSSAFTQAGTLSTFTAGSQTMSISNGTYVLSGGTFNSTSGVLTIARDFTVSGSAVFNGGTGTVTFNTASTTSIVCTNNVNFNLVTISKGAGTTVTVGSQCNLPLGNNPTVTTSASSTFTINGTLSGSGTLTYVGVNLGIASTGSLSGFSGLNLSGLSVTGTSLDLSGYTTFALTGANSGGLSLSNATLELPAATGTLSIFDVTISGTSTFIASPSAMTITRNLTISGTTNFDANGGTIIFGGSGFATVSCNNVSFNLVSIQKSAAEFTVGSNCDLPLGNNPTIATHNSYALYLNGRLSGTGTLNYTTGLSLTISSTGSISGFTGLNATGLSVTGTTLDMSTFTAFSLTGNRVFAVSNATVKLPAATGTLAVNDFTISGTSVFEASSSAMTVSGNMSITGTTNFDAKGGTISFVGGGATAACNNVTFNRVTIARPSGINFTIGSDCTFPLGNNPTVTMIAGYNITLNGKLSGTGTLTYSAVGVLSISSTGELLGFSALSGTALTVAGATLNLGSYTGVTMSSTTTLSSGTLTLPSGTNLVALTVSGGTLNAPAGILNVSGALTVSGSPTFNNGSGTVNFKGNGVTLACGNFSFNNVTLNNTGTLTVNNTCNLPLGNNPTISNSITLAGTLSGTGTAAFPTGTLTLNSGATFSGFSGLGVVTLTNAGATSNFTSFSSMSIAGTTTISSGTLTLPDGTILGGALTINGGTLGITTGGLTVNGTTTFSSGTFNAPTGILTLKGALTNSGGTFNHNNGTVNFTGTGVTLSCNNVAFNNVTLNNTGALTVNNNCSLPLGDNPTVANSITLAGTLSGTGTATFNTGTLTLSASTASLANFTDLALSALTLNSSVGAINWSARNSLTTTGSVTINASSSLLPPPVASIGGSLTITGTSSALTAATGDLTVTGGISLTTGTLTAPTGNLNIGGNFAHVSGTFNPNGGTVVFNGGSQIISGIATTFNNFTKELTSASAATLTFPASITTTITGTLVLHGYDNSARLLLRSSTNNTRWNIDAQGTRDLLYLDVKDGNNINASIMQMGGTESIDSTNNVNFNFNSVTPNDPTNLGPANVISNITALTLRPAFTFTLSDPNSLDTVKFQIQIDDNNDFSSPVIDYTSALVAQSGTKTFTTGQAVGSGTYTVGALNQSLTTGSYYWRVKATDNNGLISNYTVANSGSIAFYIDSTQPDIFTPTLNVTSPTPNARPTVSFETTDNVAINYYQVKVDSGSFSTRTSPYQVPILASGDHTIVVRAYDTTGNYTDGSVSVTIVSSPPAAFTPTLNVTSPTNNNSPILYFETTDYSGMDHYEVKLDNGGFVTRTSPYQYGVMSTGSHTYTVRAFNINNSYIDGTVTFVIDTNPPYAFGLSSNIGTYSSNSTPTITFLTADSSGINHYEIKIDSGTFTTGTSPYTIPTPLSDGSHTFVVRAYDNAGNFRDSSSLSRTIDTTAPNSFTPTTNVTSPTGNTRPTVSFSTTDNIGMNHYELKLDSGSFTTRTSPYQLTALAEGDHTVIVRAYDNAGNYTDGTLNITVVGNGPAAFTPTLNVTIPTNNQAPILSFTTTDDTGIGHYEVKLDSGGFVTRTSPYQLPTLAAGSHTITVRAFDLDNNYLDGTLNVVIDLTIPNGFTPHLNTGSVTNINTPILTFNSSDSVQMGHYEVQIDSGNFVTQTSPYQLSALDNGAHTIKVRAFDAAGNYRDGTLINVTVDTITPDPFTPELNITSPTKNTTPTVTFNTSDNLAIASYKISLDGGSFTTRTSPYQLPPQSNGSHTLTIRAYDTAGNYIDATASFIVSRTSPDPFTPTLDPISPTNNTTPALLFSTTDLAGIDHYEVKIDNSAYETQTSPFTLPTLSETGYHQTPHTITVRAFNIYGASTDGIVTLKIDTTAPVINYSVGKKFSNVDITTSFTISDNLGIDVSDITVTGAVLNCTQVYALLINCQATVSQSGTLTLSITDTAGNQSSVMIPDYVIETTAPIIAITAPTKSADSAITDTTIVVTDETYIEAQGITAVSGGTIVCTQTTNTRVDCTSTVAESGNLVINASDAAGNPASDSEDDYLITSISPDPFTPTLSTPAITNITNPILYFDTTDSDGIDHYDVKIDGGSFLTQVSPYQLPTLPLGFITITVRAYDTLGNFRDGTVSVTIESSIPEEFTPSINVSSPTNNTTPEVSFFTTDINGIDHYEVKVDDGFFLAETSPYLIPELIQGTHTIIVRAYNTIGNYRDGSIELVVDLTPPEPFEPVLNSGSITNLSAAELTYSTTDNIAISHYEVQIDSDTPSIQESPYITPTIAEGDHLITVTAFDTAGNTRVEGASTLVDLSVPHIQYNAPVRRSNHSITNTTIQITDDAIDMSEISATGGTINCTLISATQINCTSVISQSGTFSIHAGDLAGNTTTLNITGYIIETVVPVITITAPTKTSAGTITDTTVNVTDNSGIAVAGVSATGGTAVCTQTSATEVNCSVSISDSGDLVVTANDLATNQAQASETGYTITANGNIPASFTPTLDTGSVTTNIRPTVTFSTTHSSGINRYEVRLDSGDFIVQTSPYKLPELDEGFHTILVRAYSNSGDFRDGAVSVTIDLTFPTKLELFLDVESPTNNPRPIITFGAYDEVGIDHYEVKVASEGGEFTRQTSPYQVPELSEEEHEITVRAYDLAGNMIEGSAKLLADRTSPTGSVKFEDDAGYTTTRDVTILTEASDTLSGIDKMIISEDENFEASNYQSFATSLDFRLSDNTGIKTIYAKFKDKAGNESETYSTKIVYITTQDLSAIANGSSDDSQSGMTKFLEGIVNIGEVTLPFTPAAIAAGLIATNIATYPRLLIYGVYIIRFRKKRRNWGVIYDLYTKDPVGLATVRLYSSDTNKFITETMTDLEGKYGFILDKGSYRLEVKHPDYKSYSGSIDFEELEGYITRDIALGRSGGIEKEYKKTIREKLNTINKIFVYVGFLFSIIVFALEHNVVNLIILIIYLFQAIIIYYLAKKSSYHWGYVYDKDTNKRIKGAIVKVFDVEKKKQLDVIITDVNGRYRFDLPKGSYLISVYAAGYVHSRNNNSKEEVLIPVEVNKSNDVNLTIPLVKE